MSGEAETVGAAVTAGLIAAAIDSPKPQDRLQVRAQQGECPNCGASLSGKFCASCGQPANIHRTLGHMVGEFLHGLFHLDTRAWRTLPLLLFRPGTLTRSYIHGRRARFISPLAMFLLSVFAMFVVFGLTDGARLGVSDPARRAAVLEEARIEIANARREAGQAPTSQAAGGLSISTGIDVGADDATVYDEIRSSVERGDVTISTGSAALDAKIRENLLNPELALYKIQNAAYENAFLLVPISLPLVWLMFAWRRGTTLFDHTVYILYSLSFVSLTFIATSLMSTIPGAMGVLSLPLFLATLVHSFFHLKGGYGLSWFSALWRLPFQLAFAAIGFTIYLLAIIAVGFAG